MTGIGLYCSQQKRDNKTVEYNNPTELLELVEASRTLKGIHPELYERYHFQASLERLYELQPKNSLQGRIEKAMKEMNQKEEVEKQVEEIEFTK